MAVITDHVHVFTAVAPAAAFIWVEILEGHGLIGGNPNRPPVVAPVVDPLASDDDPRVVSSGKRPHLNHLIFFRGLNGHQIRFLDKAMCKITVTITFCQRDTGH